MTLSRDRRQPPGQPPDPRWLDRVDTARPEPQVLIVDNDPDMRRYLRRCLQPLAGQLGSIFEAGDGVKALAVVRAVEISLVIADLILPRLDGLSMVRKMEQEPGGRCPVVLLVSSQSSLQEARAAGVDLLLKPFDGRTVRRSVQSILGRS